MAEETLKAPSVVTLVKEEKGWLKKHAVWKNNQWYCKKTGKKILMVVAAHTIWEDDGPGPCAGSGEVRDVFHIYCPACQKKPEFTYGDPIMRSEIMENKNG